jgi:hypothetical protein
MSESTSTGIKPAPDSDPGQSESTLDQFLTEPDPQADAAPSRYSGFWPHTPPRRSSASPVSLLARLAGVIALAFAVVAGFVLVTTHSHLTAAHTTAGATHSPSARPSVTAPAHKAAPKPVKVKRTTHAKRLGRHPSGPASKPVIVVRQVTHAAPAPAPPAKPKAAPKRSPKAARKAAARPTVQVGGDVTCLSGASIEGVWVQATGHSGFAPWQGVSVSGQAFGSTSKWWWPLPKGESYSLHVGCGGTQATWGVALYTPVVTGSDTFICIDVSSDAGYGTCYVN